MDKPLTKQDVIQIVKDYLGQNAFTARKITDLPTDSLQVVPRKYVTRNFTTAKRPTTSILGESYFDTTVNKQAWWNGTSFKDAAGNIIS